jgi:hypothetical protein
LLCSAITPPLAAEAAGATSGLVFLVSARCSIMSSKPGRGPSARADAQLVNTTCRLKQKTLDCMITGQTSAAAFGESAAVGARLRLVGVQEYVLNFVSNDGGNNVLAVDASTSTYTWAQTTLAPDGLVIQKQCVGTANLQIN